MAGLIHGYTEEYWRELFFDKKISKARMAKMMGLSRYAIDKEINSRGWKRDEVSRKKRNENGITRNLIKKLSKHYNLTEKIIESDLYGTNSDPRNIDVIIHKHRTSSKRIVNKAVKCFECEYCIVNEDYCRNKFRDEYNCRRIIEAWLEEPAEDKSCFNNTVDGVMYE